MNQIERNDACSLDVFDALITFSEFFRIDPVTGEVRIETGNAQIVLRRDGTISLEARCIVGIADDRIALNAGVIELN